VVLTSGSTSAEVPERDQPRLHRQPGRDQQKTWDKLSPADQKIVLEAVQEPAPTSARRPRRFGHCAQGLEGKMQVNDVPPATLARMRELTQPVGDKFAASYDPAVVQVYRAELDKAHAAFR
jgi:TRAP-type C4-dicarboxylate transport system substrate-binding protein